MPKKLSIKLAVVAVLAGTAILVRPPDNGGWTAVLVAFGAFNILFSPPGTAIVRACAIVATFLSLQVPGYAMVALLSWFWPPAYYVAWMLGRADEAAAADGDKDPSGTRSQIAMAALIMAVAVASAAYRMIVYNRLEQTAALFIGIPALLAIVVIFAVAPESAVGVATKAVTVGLLVSLLVLGEGIVCVMMSAPLFYFVAIAIASAVEHVNRRRNERGTLYSSLIVLAILPLTLEGVTEMTTFNREETVTVSKVVPAPAQAVERALFEPPRFDRALPAYLRAGFPKAVSTRIERGPDRVRWIVHIRGGEMRLNGMEARAGELVLELEEHRPGLVRWRAVSDTSHTTHFLTWRDVVVQWQPAGADATRVTWTLRYRRDLDPAWYFGPWERYAARLSAAYLIDAVATP